MIRKWKLNHRYVNILLYIHNILLNCLYSSDKDKRLSRDRSTILEYLSNGKGIYTVRINCDFKLTITIFKNNSSVTAMINKQITITTGTWFLKKTYFVKKTRFKIFYNVVLKKSLASKSWNVKIYKVTTVLTETN